MSEFSLTIPDEAWVPNPAVDPPGAALLVGININGTLVHLEAWEVDRNAQNVQVPVSLDYLEDFGSLYDAVHADGPFTTTTINGREYILVASPYCWSNDMPMFKVTEKVVTYCTTEVEAESAEAAIALVEATSTPANDFDWSYETNYDDSLGIEAEPI